jgi:hypothetical protein
MNERGGAVTQRADMPMREQVFGAAGADAGFDHDDFARTL